MDKTNTAQGKYQGGFTLVELGIAMIIFMLLLAGAVVAVRVQTQRAAAQQTQAALAEAKEAILGYVAANGRLPCPAEPFPAASTDIGKSRAAGCTLASFRRGLIPWKTLGISGLDAWDQYLTYQVTPDFTATGFSVTAPTSIYDAPLLMETKTVTPSASIADDGSVAFAIWSHGANGHYAINFASRQQLAGTNTIDENVNSPTVNMNGAVVARPASEQGSSYGEFDDSVIWVSRFTLFKRLMDAGYNIPLS
ncbi:MAG: hypothetical protein JWL63_1330 [Rhodocyclales bacterium]|nr:hypothetical protein [Rhodocyclales bacterium]